MVLDESEEVCEVERPQKCYCCITDKPGFCAVWFQYKQTGLKYSGGISKKSLQKSCLAYTIPLLKKVTRNSIKTYQCKLSSQATELGSVLTDASMSP